MKTGADLAHKGQSPHQGYPPLSSEVLDDNELFGRGILLM
jgi:hypothetical protein